LVVTLTVLCVVGGVAVAILGRHSPLLVGLGLIVAVTAVAVFPRPLRLGEGDVLLDRSHAAQFWELLFEIAHAVKTPPPELVVVDMEPNASVTNVGLRVARRPPIGRAFVGDPGWPGASRFVGS
jgi:hypothetical protein